MEFEAAVRLLLSNEVDNDVAVTNFHLFLIKDGSDLEELIVELL